MRGVDFFRQHARDYEAAVLEAVAAGLFAKPTWHQVWADHAGYRACFWVSGDWLAIGDEEPVRACVSARLAQRISDRLGLAPVTARMDDHVHSAATAKLAMIPQPSKPADRVRQGLSPSMSDVEAIIFQSARVDAQMRGVEGRLASGAYKSWVAARRQVAARSPEYGAHAPWAKHPAVTNGSPNVVQPRAYFHDPAHVDYAMGFRMWVDYAEVDGRAMTVRELAAHPDLWPLVSDEGPIAELSYLPPEMRAIPGSHEALGRLATSAPDTVSRVLSNGSLGPEVMLWQRVVGADQDGVFGRVTEVKTKLWQRTHGIYPDGVVGEKTWASAGYVLRLPDVPWRAATAAAACLAALRDADRRWPNRAKASDGVMGDASHQSRKSDHNLGLAVDVTHDPASGCLGDVITAGAIVDSRSTYVIWNKRIYSRARASEGWRPYDGANPHTHYVHVSVREDARDDQSPWPWAA